MKLWKAVKIAAFTVTTKLLGSSAFACSVCIVSEEKTRNAYYSSTAMLSLFPLLMVGGIVYYVYKKTKG